MKSKSRILSVILCASMLLGGCGNGGGKDGYTLSECLNSGESIWYSISGEYGKSASVATIYVMEKDGSMYYATTDKNLGELEQMKDKDIAAMVKEDYQNQMSERIGMVIDELETKQNEEYSGAEEYVLDELRSIYLEALYMALVGEENEANEMLESCFEGEYLVIVKDAFGRLKDRYPELSEEEDTFWIMESEIWESGTETSAIIEEAANAIYTKEKEEFEASKADYESIIASLKEYQSDIEPAQYKLSIITDSTGNNAQSEVLVYQEAAPLKKVQTDNELVGYAKEVNSITLNYSFPYENANGSTGNCFEVYDSWYGMYTIGEKAFCTRTDKNTTFMLDGVDTKNIAIDDTESLFDTECEITMQ